jgi:1-acyl-sn-glycerol-3-phosphate acyltransferase
VADRYSFPPITAAVRSYASFDRVRAIGPSLTERVSGSDLIEGAQMPVLRGGVDRAPVRLALDLLEAGGVLGIFPEGTRGDGRVERAMPGVGYFAVRTGAVVLPVAIHGSAEMTHRRSSSRPRVRKPVGTPVTFERAEVPLHRRDWLDAAECVRLALADLVRATEFSRNQASAPATPETAKARS